MPAVAEVDTTRYSALEWAAYMRGAKDADEALGWMTDRGLVVYDFETDGVTFTEDGVRRGDELAAALRKAPEARAKRRRGTLMLVAAGLAAVVAWRR